MIKGSSLTTDLPDIEHMLVIGEETAGSGDIFTSTVKREDITPEQQAIYDAGITLVTGKYHTEIQNTVSELQISRVTSEVLAEGEDVFDFETMNEVDKDALRALLALFIELKD